MLTVLADVGTAFLLGLLTPLTAVCVIPLYPGFLSYLSNRASEETSVVVFSLLVTAGIVVFMFLTGLLFTAVLEVSLTRVIGVVSPVAFGILALVSILLIVDFDFTRIFPQVSSPRMENPYVEALTFGLFFGAIVLPCNPAFITALFVTGVTTIGFYLHILQFVAFGLGMGAPLIALAVVSQPYKDTFISKLTTYKEWINRVTGAVMLAVSLYYLILVFEVFG